MKLSHHSHHCHCSVNLVQVFDITADDLQITMVIGVRVDQLDGLLREHDYNDVDTVDDEV